MFNQPNAYGLLVISIFEHIVDIYMRRIQETKLKFMLKCYLFTLPIKYRHGVRKIAKENYILLSENGPSSLGPDKIKLTEGSRRGKDFYCLP